jgi:hypothetical protein
MRADLGRRAHQTVRERYATGVVAARYFDVLANLCPRLRTLAAVN